VPVAVPARRRGALPHPKLAAHVLGYTFHDFPAAEPVSWRFNPLGVVTLGLDFEAPQRRVGGADLPPSPVLGLRDGPLEAAQSCASRRLAIGLTPPSAYTLLGMPLRDLANTAVGLEDLLGRDAVLLAEQLSENPSTALLTARLRDAPAPPVLGRLAPADGTRGRPRIAGLATDAG
jgi:hypothetical protein